MKNDEKSEIERLDPESEACFKDLANQIAWELGACIAAGGDPSTPTGIEALSELIADAVLDGFVVRRRTTSRYGRWYKPSDSLH